MFLFFKGWELWVRLADRTAAGKPARGDMQAPRDHPHTRADGRPPQDLHDGDRHGDPAPPGREPAAGLQPTQLQLRLRGLRGRLRERKRGGGAEHGAQARLQAGALHGQDAVREVAVPAPVELQLRVRDGVQQQILHGPSRHQASR